MLFLPWTKTSLTVCYTLLTITIVCYLPVLYLFVVAKDFKELVTLIVALIVSQLSYILYIYFGNRVLHSDSLADYLLEWFSLGLSYMLFCVVHWEFAFKYWRISLQISD